MAIILRDLYQRYCLTSDDVKTLLLNTYNIQNIHDDLVLDDEQAEYIIDTIYGKIDNDVDIHYDGTDEKNGTGKRIPGMHGGDPGTEDFCGKDRCSVVLYGTSSGVGTVF